MKKFKNVSEEFCLKDVITGQTINSNILNKKKLSSFELDCFMLGIGVEVN